MTVEMIFQIAILVFSVIVHEVSHGMAALYLGDHTAERAGRLTLNPLPHIDPLGSLILPALMALSGSSIVFGWAKPVPYNPYNLRKGGRFGEAIVAAAGPLSNLALALLFALVLHLGIVPAEAVRLVILAVYINVMLALFNLIPVPPLDGSKVLPALLPRALAIRYAALVTPLQRNVAMGFAVVFGLLLLAMPLLNKAVITIASILLR